MDRLSELYEDLRSHKGATANQAERFIAALDGSGGDVDAVDFELQCLRSLGEKVREKRAAYEVESAAAQARREARGAARAAAAEVTVP
jgi:hypothetical protein